MRIYLVIKLQFEAIHCWNECNIDEVSFLKNEHRHIFFVKMKWEVNHSNREIEFINKKREVQKFININLDKKNLGNSSCEDIAILLLNKFKCDYVSIFEDNENGAEVMK